MQLQDVLGYNIGQTSPQSPHTNCQGVMIWACFTSMEPGEIETMINKTLYRNVLETNVSSSVQHLNLG